MHASHDTLIIGHGLAGAILAHTLISRGQRVMVIDQDEPTTASKVAAGIINPVTGHRLNISEGFEKLIPTALQTYQELAERFGEAVYSPLQQIRLLKNQGQYDYFTKRTTEPQYSSILGNHIAKPENFVCSEFGAVEVRQSGTVNTRKLLSLSQQYLVNNHAYQSLELDYTALNIGNTGVTYEGMTARRVIFCEGYRATRNPWLQGLPFKLAKGEIVNIKIETELARFLNWGSWLIPDAQPNSFRLGSTFEWTDLSLTSTKSASLLASLTTFTGLQAKPISTDVGIRPTTLHRCPFVGPIGNIPNSYCFNGFGSKGCLLIPTYAMQLADNIMQSKPLARELVKWL